MLNQLFIIVTTILIISRVENDFVVVVVLRPW